MEADMETLRKLALKRARREVRGAMSDTADIILATYIKQVEMEFAKEVQNGRMMEFVPRIATPKELLGVAAMLVLEDGTDG
jgi:hypothetical protein